MSPVQSSDSSRLSLETAGVWALLLTLVAALFAFIPALSIPFVATKTFVLATGALISLGLFIFARLSRGNIVFPSTVLLGALWLPAMAYLASALFSSGSFANAFWGASLESDTLGFVLVASVLGTLTALTLRDADRYRSFLRVSGRAFGVLVVLQLAVVLVGQFAPNIISPAFSFVGSLSDLAAVLGLGIVGVLATLRDTDLGRRMQQLLLGTLIGALALLVVLNSSLVWALLAIVSLGFFVESVMRHRAQGGEVDLEGVQMIDEGTVAEVGGNQSLLVPLAVLAVSLFFLVGGALGNALATALHVNQINVRPSWQTTFVVGQKVYASTPFFGSGPGTFGADWVKYRDVAMNATAFWNVDFPAGVGVIPTAFVTTGILGAVAWIVFLCSFLALGLRLLILRAPQDPFVRSISFLSFLAALYLFTIAIFDLPDTVVLALAFVCAGLFISTMRFGAEGKQSGIVFARSPRLGFVIVFSLTILLLGSVALGYSLVGRYIAATELTAASAALSGGNLDMAAQATQSALSFAPTPEAYQLQAGIAHSRLAELASSQALPPATVQKTLQSTLSSGISAALTATRLSPGDYQSWVVLGNLYAQVVPLGITGAYESAKSAYGKARELNPTSPQILYLIAQLDIANKDLKSAEDDLKAAIALKSDYIPAIFLFSQLEVQSGNIKNALAAAIAAAYFAPNDPSILFQEGVLYAAQGDYQNAVAVLNEVIAANPQFANARYFLSAVYAKQGDTKSALAQMQAIAAISSDNARAVATQVNTLKSGKNPFPANFLSAPSTPVK